MVSTRGPKSAFSENERVLCYEPDLTKAKVLYDSKVRITFIEFMKPISNHYIICRYTLYTLNIHDFVLPSPLSRSWKSTRVATTSAAAASWST